jgi:hypothetical protein
MTAHRYDRSEINTAFKRELTGLISSLQDQVKSIRMAQASEFGQGPLDGMRKEIENLARSHQSARLSTLRLRDFKATLWAQSRSGRRYRTLTIEGT